MAGLLALVLVPFALFDDAMTTMAVRTLDGARREPAVVVALVILLLASDTVLPIPSSVVSTFAGAALGWGEGAATIWAGATLGGVLGYVLGRGVGRGAATRLVGRNEIARAQRMVDRIGPTVLILTRAVPVAAEAATLLAGVARMRPLPFLIATGVGNLAMAVTYAGIGATAMSSGSFVLAFAGLVLLPGLAWGLWQAMRARRRAGPPA